MLPPNCKPPRSRETSRDCIGFQCTLGFGAGMGLPNMRRNATDFDIQSQVGVGTTIMMSFALKG